VKGLPPLYGVSSVDKARLEEAGVKNLRALADLPNVEDVARLVDVEPKRLDCWRDEAKRALFARRAHIALAFVIACVVAAAVLVQTMTGALRRRPEDYHSADLQASLDEQVEQHLATIKSHPGERGAQAALDEILSHSLAAARHLRDEKEWEEALHIYARVLKIDAGNDEARFYRGWILLQEKRYEEAIRAFQQSPPNTSYYRDWAYLNLAIAEENSGHEAKADRPLKLAAPTFVPALLQRASIARSNGRLDESKALYEAILATDPRNEVALYGIYNLTAAPDYRHRIEQLGSRHVDWLKAEDKFRAGDFKGAVDIYERMLTAAPGDAQILRNLGKTYVMWGASTSDAEMARRGITCLQDLLARGDAPPEANFSLAWAFQVAPGRAKNLEAAKTYYQAYLDKAPSDHAASNNLASVLLGTGDRKGFLELARRNAKMMPHDVDAHLNLSYGLYLDGDIEGGLKECRAGMALNKNSAVAPLQCGELAFWHGDLRQAFDHFEWARRLARREGEAGEIWTLLLMSPFGGEPTDRLIYYDTLARKEAGLDLLQALVRLAEKRPRDAQQLARTALAHLTDAPEDLEIVRRALNDLARFEARNSLTKDGLALRTTIEGWKKEKERSSG
jgi:tetratricopeptide (TPR) repeat protein